MKILPKYDILKREGRFSMKKIIYFTYMYHAVCFVSMTAGQFTENSGLIRASWMADIGGTFVLPLVIAVMAMVSALHDEQRVIRFYPPAAAAVGAVGLARSILFFFVGGKNGFIAAMTYLIISFLLLTLWFLIFEISYGFMNRGTKINRKFGGKRK